MVSEILIVMIAAIAVSIVADRRGIQPPLLLAFVGLIASFIPGLSRLELDPEIILTVVVPPLLYSAATELSFISFLKRLGSIVNLGMFLVAATTGVVGLVAAAIVPGMTLPVALVLGAVVSPPDAVAAVAVGRQLGLPSRMMTLLKGESLINDAAALTLFTFATASVAGTHLFIPNLFGYLGYSVVAGVLIGVAIGFIVHRTRLKLTNASLSTVLSVLVPFTAYIVAEELGASGVLAVVAAGFSLGHNSSETDYASRLQEREFWHTMDALLEAFVFAYLGLQLRFVIEDAVGKGYSLPGLLGVSLLVLLAVVVVRIAWVCATAVLFRWRHRAAVRKLADPEFEKRLAEHAERRRQRNSERGRERPEGKFEFPEPFRWRENLVIGWTGMRGVVTLAAAAGIPLLTATGDPFPGRDVIQVIAFVVTIGTLLVQGLTLPWLIGWLDLSDPTEAKARAEQVAFAEDVAQQAAIEAIAAFRDRQTEERPRQMASRMLARMDQRNGDTQSGRQLAISSEGAAPAEIVTVTPAPVPAEALQEQTQMEGGTVMLTLAREMLAARRSAVVKARDDRRLDDEVMREVLEQMDLEQAVMANWSPGRLGRR